MSQTYPFSKRFVADLLALIVKDKENGNNLLSKLDPNLFALKSDSLIFSILKQQKSFGGWNHLRSLLELQFELGKVKYEDLDSALNTLKQASEVTKLDVDGIIDVFKKSILRINMSNALQQAIHLYRDGQYDEILESISETLNFVKSLEMTVDLPMSMSLKTYVEDIHAQKSFTERFPIGVVDLDTKLMGGLGRGELGVVVAGRKGGKSILLCHAAQTAILLGHNVLYFTFELMADVVKHRIAGGLLNIPVNDILHGGEGVARIVRDKLSVLLKQTGGDFGVKFAPGKSMTIDDIAVYISNYERITKRKVDMIIIDYADLVRPQDKLKDYEALDAIYLGARALGSPVKYPNIASGFNAAVWTGSQIQRDAMHNDLITEADIARCIGKTDHLDTLLAICRTEQEMEDRVARLYVPICRIVEGGSNIGEIGPYSTDFEYGRIFDPNEVERLNIKCQKKTQISSLTDPFTTG